MSNPPELELHDGDIVTVEQYVLRGVGAVFTVLTLLLFYHRTYLFFYENNLYLNRKRLYRWLKDGNEPTRGKYFEIFPHWIISNYSISISTRDDKIWYCIDNDTDKMVMCGFTSSKQDKKQYTEILEMLKEW